MPMPNPKEFYDILAQSMSAAVLAIGRPNEYALWKSDDNKGLGLIVKYKFDSGLELSKFPFYSHFFTFRDKDCTFVPV